LLPAPLRLQQDGLTPFQYPKRGSIGCCNLPAEAVARIVEPFSTLSAGR